MDAQSRSRRSRTPSVAAAGPPMAANSCCSAGVKSGSKPRSIMARRATAGQIGPVGGLGLEFAPGLAAHVGRSEPVFFIRDGSDTPKLASAWLGYGRERGRVVSLHSLMLAATSEMKFGELHGRPCSGPTPISDFRQILTVLVDVLLVFDQLVLELLLQVDALFRRSAAGGRSCPSQE